MKLSQIISLTILSIFLMPYFSLAQIPPPEQTPPPEIPTSFFGCLPIDTLRVCMLKILGQVLRFILVLALALAAGFIALAGINYILAGGVEEKRKAATNKILYAAAGLVVAFLAWVATFLLSRLVGTGTGI